MNYPIVKSFTDNNTAQQIEQKINAGEDISVYSWQKILSVFSQFIDLNPGEEIAGIAVDHTSVKFLIQDKPELSQR